MIETPQPAASVPRTVSVAAAVSWLCAALFLGAAIVSYALSQWNEIADDKAAVRHLKWTLAALALDCARSRKMKTKNPS
jgi:hypothetical protein